jgi:hypothetical protein
MFQTFGLLFDPFQYLDSTKDARLHEYLVVPKTVEIAWGDESAAILAQRGGGKSALRVYTEQVYRGTRGVKLPITYIPETYSPDPECHFSGIRRSLARSLLIYLISYPDVFLRLAKLDQEKTKSLLSFLSYQFDFLLDVLEHADAIQEIEQLLRVNALSGIQKFGQSHRRLFACLKETRFHPLTTHDITLLLQETRQIFDVSAFHILLDGLDGFIETTSPEKLYSWLKPLMMMVKPWAAQKIYLKFFLPISVADFASFDPGEIRTATLLWDDSLLAEVIRRRLYVASQGAFDSLDAVSAPNLRNVELHLARQLCEREKLPRLMIRQTRALLEKARHAGVISNMDVFEEKRDARQSTTP